MTTRTTIGIVDDHQLFLKSLSLLIASFPEFEVILEALHGKDLQQKLEQRPVLPEILLVDVNMPLMDGMATSKWMQERHPSVRLVALSMNDNDASILGMIRQGCCAYLLKDAHPNTLEKALQSVRDQGYYNGDISSVNLNRLLRKAEAAPEVRVTPKEHQFLQLACSELTYKQIAGEMKISERTVDGYRETLFQKFGVQSRVGLCLEAIRKQLVSL